MIFIADKTRTYKTFPNWKIMWRLNRGYEPYYTLHKKRELFGFTWYSGVKRWSGESSALEGFILRWEGFDNE